MLEPFFTRRQFIVNAKLVTSYLFWTVFSYLWNCSRHSAVQNMSKFYNWLMLLAIY